MLETIIITFIICKIKGYKIIPLFKSKAFYPIIFMEIINLIIQINIFIGNLGVIKFVGILKVLYICSYLPLIFKYKQYISAIVGSIFMLIGGVLNNIAIKANNGMMPVFPKLSYITGYASYDYFNRINDIHILGDSTTKIKWLTDIFDLGYCVLSIGDIFVRLYAFIIIYNVVKYLNKEDVSSSLLQKETE